MGSRQLIKHLTDLLDTGGARERRARAAIRQVLHDLRIRQRVLIAEREQADPTMQDMLDRKIAVIQQQRRKGIAELRTPSGGTSSRISTSDETVDDQSDSIRSSGQR